MGLPRILLISPLPPPAGGIATWTRRILQSDLSSRFRFRVINCNVGIDTGKKPLTVLLRKIWISVRTLLLLFFNLVFLRPKMVHINTSAGLGGLYRDLMYMLMAKIFWVKVVLHFRTSRFHILWGYKKLRWLTKMLLNMTDTMFVLSHKEKKVMNDCGFNLVQQVNNFTVHRPKPVRNHLHPGPVRFLFVGWIMRRKGVFEILEAVAKLPNIHVTMLGRFVDSAGENSESATDEAISRLGISDKVTLAGEIPYTKVWEYFDNADAFLLPSHLEGFSNALLESMMAGLPALSTPVGAGDEAVIHGKTGLVTPVADSEAVFQAMKTLAEDADLRKSMGDAAYQRVMDHYELKSATAALGDRWQKVISPD